MAMSVDGLVTGMKTTDTINQLMQVEAMPQAALKTKVTVAGKAVAAYQSVNTRLSSLAIAAKALGNADTWGAMKATSSSTAAVVSAAPGSGAGSMSFQIDKLATTHAMTYSAGSVGSVSDAAAWPVIAGATFDIVVPDGTLPATKTVTLTPADASLQSVVAAINGSTESLYRASAVQIGPGQYTLQLTAKESGSAAATAINTVGGPSGLTLGAPTVTFAGDDAQLTVGNDPATAYTITSKSNTFANVMSGVTVTAVRAHEVGDSPITISTTPDVDGLAAKVQALVDNANVALNEIESQSRVKNGDTPAGVLAGDSTMRKLSQDILSAVASGVTIDGDFNSFSAVGIGLDRNGAVTFDKQTFVDAYKADPDKTEAYFDSYTDVPHAKATSGKFEPGWDTPKGIGRKLEAFAVQASEGVILPTDPATKAKQGLMQTLIQRRNDVISDLNDQVSAWDVRLDLRQKALEKQFSSLEVALGKMHQQSSWLAGQLATLS